MPTIYQPPKKKKDAGRVYRSDRNRDNANYKWVYNTSTWRSLRLAYIAEHVFCERCKEAGKLVLGEHVHHKIPIDKGKTRLAKELLGFDYNNLESLCRECHRIEHIKPTFIYD